MLLLGFGHRARQGKSVACDAILERCSYINVPCKVYSFGQAVLDYCQREGLISPGVCRARLTPEHLVVLQRVGLEKRQGNPNFWIDQLAAQIAKDRHNVALIPNVRFPNEADWTVVHGGFCVLVERYTEAGKPYLAADRDINHISEQALVNWPWDFRLSARDGEVAWLRRQAVALFDYLRG